MMRSALALVGGLIVIFTVSWAWPQEDVIVFKGDGKKSLERPAVSFPHEKHAQVVECTGCHHDYDIYGVNKGSEGQKCSDCHGNPSVQNPIPLQRAFHEQCLSCHERVHARQGRSLPVMCGQCHVK